MADSVEDLDPVAALAAIDQTRARLAGRIGHAGWRYDLIYSALASVGVAGQALPMPLNIMADAVTVVGLVLLMRWWIARTGVCVSGIAPARTRWVTVGIAIVFGVSSVFGAVEARQGRPWVALALAGGVAVVALLGSRLWRLGYLSEIEAGALADPEGGRRFGLRPSSWIFVSLGLVSALAAGMSAAMGADGDLVSMLSGMAVALLAAPVLLVLKRRLTGR